MTVARRAAAGLTAVACFGAGSWLAAVHPLSPWAALALWALWLWAAWRWPRLWLFAVPALLPVAGLMLWTGWVARDEFDLVVLGALAAGHARLALARGRDALAAPAPCRWQAALVLLLWASVLAGLALAWADAQRMPLHEARPYTGFSNSLRVAKAMVYALLALPLLRPLLQRAPRAATRRLALGMGTGLVGLSLAVLWERASLPGLLNFGSDYRTVGLFWEMHVGGAAIDFYLALAVPFAVWAVVAARGPRRWLAAAVLLQVLAYVCLTTFARGVYGAVLGGLVVAAVLWSWRVRTRVAPMPVWRARANAVLWVLLVAQVLAMGTASSYMVDRLRASDNDFGSRMAHWARGLSVAQTPRDWLVGIGLGRLPERYAAQGSAGEFPGAALLLDDAPPSAHGPFLRLMGPPSRMQLAGRYGMAQQVAPSADGRYRLQFDMRAGERAFLRFRVCERHLLYELDCVQRFVIRRAGTAGQWVPVDVNLFGRPLSRGEAWAPRLVSLDVSVVHPGTRVDLDNLRLSTRGGGELLANGDFARGLAHWYPSIDGYFLPWHIDNLYLELLLERGVLGLVLVGTLLGGALWRLSFGAARHQRAAPWLAASLASVCALGLVSSVMDMPRVAFAVLLLAWWAWCLPPARAGVAAAGRDPGL